MNPKRATSVVLIAALLSAWSAPRAAGHEPPARPAAPPPVRSVLSFLAKVAGSILSNGINQALNRSGLFDAFGPDPTGPDPVILARLDEIRGRLDTLDREIGALTDDVERLESLLLTLPARQTLAVAQTRFDACYARLDALARTPVTDPELAAQHERTVLGRAYQTAGIPSPLGLGFSDQDCSLLEPLRLVQATLLPEAPGSTRPLLEIARLARQKGASFEEVAAYFTWSVAIQRRAMILIAQAHHRLGEDALLAETIAPLDESLRRQAIEFLHAAEAYVAYQRVDQPYSGEALALADQIVARMMGTTRFVTTSVLFFPHPGASLATPTLAQGSEQLVLDDALVAQGETYYGRDRQSSVAPESADYFYVLPRGANAGVEVGRADHVALARFRTSQVRGGPVAVTLTEGGRTQSLTLERRNAATMEAETAEQDRLLLSHSDGFATPVARFRLLPEPGDPRKVRLTVDEPARGLAGVPIGLVGGTGFAARPGLEASVVELVPAGGPAEPDRYALRLGDRWLGVVHPADGAPEPYAPVVLVDAPFPFELTRDGEVFRLSYVTENGRRRHLYVNEQIVSASGWRVANAPGAADLLSDTFSGQFVQASAPSVCPTLAMDVVAGARPAIYWISGEIRPNFGNLSTCNISGTCGITLSWPYDEETYLNGTITEQIGSTTIWHWDQGLQESVHPVAGQTSRLRCSSCLYSSPGPDCYSPVYTILRIEPE